MKGRKTGILSVILYNSALRRTPTKGRGRDTAAGPGAERLIRDATREISRADAKAGILFTGAGIVLSVPTSLIVASRTGLTGLPLRLEIPLLVSAAGAAMAFAALGLAAYPRGVRMRIPADGGVLFFGDDTVQRVRQLSLIAYQKYRCIKMAFLFFAFTLAGVVVVEAYAKRSLLARKVAGVTSSAFGRSPV